MPHIQDIQFDQLGARGFTGALQDRVYAWLLSLISSPVGMNAHINDLWHLMLTERGYSGSNGDMWFQLLGDLGLTGTLQDRELAFWEIYGGVFPIDNLYVNSELAGGDAATAPTAHTIPQRTTDIAPLDVLNGFNRWEMNAAGATLQRAFLRYDLAANNPTLEVGAVYKIEVIMSKTDAGFDGQVLNFSGFSDLYFLGGNFAINGPDTKTGWMRFQVLASPFTGNFEMGMGTQSQTNGTFRVVSPSMAKDNVQPLVGASCIIYHDDTGTTNPVKMLNVQDEFKNVTQDWPDTSGNFNPWGFCARMDRSTDTATQGVYLDWDTTNARNEVRVYDVGIQSPPTLTQTKSFPLSGLPTNADFVVHSIVTNQIATVLDSSDDVAIIGLDSEVIDQIYNPPGGIPGAIIKPFVWRDRYFFLHETDTNNYMTELITESPSWTESRVFASSPTEVDTQRPKCIKSYGDSIFIMAQTRTDNKLQVYELAYNYTSNQWDFAGAKIDTSGDTANTTPAGEMAFTHDGLYCVLATNGPSNLVRYLLYRTNTDPWTYLGHSFTTTEVSINPVQSCFGVNDTYYVNALNNGAAADRVALDIFKFDKASETLERVYAKIENVSHFAFIDYDPAAYSPDWNVPISTPVTSTAAASGAQLLTATLKAGFGYAWNSGFNKPHKYGCLHPNRVRNAEIIALHQDCHCAIVFSVRALVASGFVFSIDIIDDGSVTTFNASEATDFSVDLEKRTTTWKFDNKGFKFLASRTYEVVFRE